MSNPRAYAAKVTREVEEEVEGAVRLGRRLRSALKNTQAMQKEVDSLKSVVHKLVEYAASQRMDIEFKKCSSAATEEDDEDDEDGHYYEVNVEMKRIDERSNDGRLVRASDLANACEEEIRSGLKSARFGGVTVDEVRAAYSPHSEAYTVRAFLAPPLVPKQKAEVISKKKRKSEADEEAALMLQQMPDAEECVQFYTKRPRTWKLFGYDVNKK